MKKIYLFVLFLLTATSLYAGMVDNYGTGAKATALGGAFSAMANDPFAVYYNPAGLAGINKKIFTAGSLFISPEVKVSDYRITGGAALGDPGLSEPTGFSNSSKTLVSPHLGFAMPLNEKFGFGIAAYAPWGMEVEWQSDPSKNPGSYNSFHSYYMREVITPSLAYNLSPKLSIGAGISIGKSKTGNEYNGLGLGSNAVKATLEDKLNHSLNLGIMYKPMARLTFGLVWRGETETEFKGGLEVQGIGRVADVNLEYNHPQQIQGGVRFIQDAEKKLSIELDVVWTNWQINRNQKQLVATTMDLSSYGLPASFTESIQRDWNNTTQLRLGVQWLMTDTLTLRGGYYYDPSPVPDTSMDFIWPDGDKQTISAGAGIKIGQFNFDLVVACAKTTGARKITGESSSLNGSYGNEASTASVSLNAEGKVYIGGLSVSYLF